MKSLIAIALIALTLTTGFTCSKNTPEAAKTDAPAQGMSETQPSQEQMAQPPADPAIPQPQPTTETAPPAEGETK